jgi:hypothetical protein
MFQLKTNNNTINLKWGTWSMREFTKQNNIGIDEYFKVLATAQTNLDVIVQLVYIGYKSACISNKVDVEYTMDEVCDWIDEVGGIFDEKGQIIDYMKYIVESTVHTVQGVKKEEEEKKKPNKAKLG